MDDERADDQAQADAASRDGESSFQVPQIAPPPGAPPTVDAPVAAAGELTGTAALSADLTAAWSNLDQTARLLVNASAAALILVLVGLPLSIWDSAPFALLILTASVITIATGWFGGHPAARTMPIPLPTIELVATHVAAILAILKVVELVLDLESADAGMIVGLILAIGLAVATVAMVIAATRRGADPLGAVTRGDQGTKIATAGLVLVVLGWAFNLSVSFWTMGQAPLPLAVLTIAALTIAEAPRIQSPVPVAWVGAAIAAFGAILVLGQFGDLTRLGRTQLSLDAGDYLGFLGYAVGTVLIIAGGVLSGRSQWKPIQTGPAGPTGAEVPTGTAESPTRADEGEPTL